MDERFDNGGLGRLKRYVPWGASGLPGPGIDFVYPDNPVKRFRQGAVLRCAVDQLDREFTVVVGPEAHFFYDHRAGQFLYFMNADCPDLSRRPLNRDDLLLVRRVWRRPSNFGPAGLPFVDTGRFVPSEALFTGHPTAPPWDHLDSNEGPPGANPSPALQLAIYDCTVCYDLVAAHWLTTTAEGLRAEAPPSN